MTKITRKLEALFKQKVSNPDEDDGIDNSGGEYWEFNDPEDVEFWSLELIPMSN
jgi:hypothetical protein